MSGRRALLAGSLMSLATCGDSEPTAPPDPVATAVTLSTPTVNFASLLDTEQLTATVRDQNGATLGEAPVSWASSDAQVATVSSAGLVTALRNGSATIAATSGSVSGIATITIDQVAATLAVSPSSVPFPTSVDTVRLTATVTDGGGTALPDTAVTWEASDASIAIVSPMGLVTAVAAGSATITAAADGIDATAMIQVDAVESALIAFIGDDGSGYPTNGAGEVFQLIKDEGADLLLHQGDFDYFDDPALWFSHMDEVLGPDFPVVASVGNHDSHRWGGSDGYQAGLEERATRHGITWTGEYGEAASILFRGVRILLSAPGIFGGVLGDPGEFYESYLRGELATAPEAWRICNFHLNQEDMQVGVPGADEAGWGVYEACRDGGAIIATGHQHNYSRTHLLSDMSDKTIASTSDTLLVEPGTTFAFVSGLGGVSISSQDRFDPWWATVYSSTQGANFGALFGVFNVEGVRRLAHFYFKNVDGEIIDDFWVRVPIG